MGKNKKRMIEYLMLPVILLSLICTLPACQVIEPEDRAYPQIIGIDWKKGTYTVWMNLASLSEDTGQTKQSSDTQPGKDLYFTGSTVEAIRAAYESTREQYLDIGHVQALIFGSTLQNDQEVLKKTLEMLEAESTLGNSPYIFTTRSIPQLAETMASTQSSPGDFLTGFYENKTGSTTQPLKLADLYRNMHTHRSFPQPPEIQIQNQPPTLSISGLPE